MKLLRESVGCEKERKRQNGPASHWGNKAGSDVKVLVAKKKENAKTALLPIGETRPVQK